jgi:hypothetical protein
MSKKLEKRAARLARKAENRATLIRQVVRAYKDSQVMNQANLAREMERQREIELAVARYSQARKALKRVRQKMQLKKRDPRNAAPRRFPATS